MKLYYSIVDYFPPYRVDVAELFGNHIAAKDVSIEWYMARNHKSHITYDTFLGQAVNLPIKLTPKNIFYKLFNKFFYWLYDLLGILKCLFKVVDVIQVRDKYLAALVGLLVAKIKGIAFIYWCSYPFPEHDHACYQAEKRVKKLFYLARAKFGHLTLYRIVMPLSRHTFVQSDQMRLDIAAYGVPSAKMSVVPMGVPQRLLDWAKTQAIQVVAGRVVYLGTMASVRQLHVLIDAFAIVAKRCPQASLLMIGDGDHAHERAALESQVAKLGLSHAVRFTGFVPIEEAWSLSASAAVCVSPFYPTKVLASTSPTKLVEYMALGRPVVCNNHPEQSNIIQQSGAGLCVEWGVQPFADAIIAMLENPTQAESMGAKGPAWVNANRTYSIIAAQVWRTYQSILPQASLQDSIAEKS